MTFELSEDHETFRKVVRDFAEREVAPHVAQWDREHHFPVDVVHAMGELGLFGLVVPEQYGGSGGDFTTLCVAIEELGRVDQSIGITLEAGVGLGINPILTYGTDEQKQQWLPDLVAGRALAGFGLTEPEAGSDAGATRTRAVLDAGEWTINGAKAFITNSGTDITSLVTVTARTGEGEISLDHRAVGHARLHRRAALRQARLAHLRHPRPDLRRLPGPRGQPARHAAATASASSSPSWTTAASRSPPWPSVWRRAASTCRCATRTSGTRSASRSARARRWRSRSATSPSRSRRRGC